DGDVALQIVNLRKPIVERNKVAEAVHRLELAMLHQFVCQGNAVDLLAAILQVAHAAEDQPVFFKAEVVLGNFAANREKRRLVGHDGAENKALGIQIDRKRLFDKQIP